MSSTRVRRVFFVTLPNGKREHRISATLLTFAIVTRVDVLWHIEAVSTAHTPALKRAQGWLRKMRTSMRNPKDYEARVLPMTCEELPPGRTVRATCPAGRPLKTYYWPTLGEKRPRWAVLAAAKEGWKAVDWPTDDLEASMALTKARQNYPGIAPRLVPVDPEIR
jgi:hypothetical protein